MAKRPSKFRMALTAGRLASRQALGTGTGARDLALGELLTSQLDEAKGLAMKLGQIVSYMGVPLSEPVQAKLAKLQTGVVGMSAERTREIVEESLAGVLEDHFDTFTLEPVAAASIGQVHRAVVDGAAVAVKVQYPEIAGTFAHDLDIVTRIASLASLASAVDGKAIVNELASRLEEECDYAREARMQQQFSDAFAADLDVIVPQVDAGRSNGTVLTTEWIDGDTFESLRAQSDPERLAHVASTLIRFSYRSLFNLAAIQADPHPGNFIFVPPAGRVAFLDFGCVRPFEPAFVELLREQAEAARDHDRRKFRDTTIALGLAGKPKRFDFDHFLMVTEHLYRPLTSSKFTFTPEYMREGYGFNGPTSPNARTMAMPRAYIWVARLQWGLWSILSMLGASGSFEEILSEVLAAPVTPLVHPA